MPLRRLPRVARAAAGERIRALELADATSFDEIFRRVEAALDPLPRIGPLAIYDVALRLGAVLGLPPTRVYLQRGALLGARALGIRTRERALPLDAFPHEFRRLHAWEIENFLCRFAPELAALAAHSRAVA